MGNFVEFRESPSRALFILKKAQTLGMPVKAPQDFGLDPILKIHSKDYNDYLEGAYEQVI